MWVTRRLCVNVHLLSRERLAIFVMSPFVCITPFVCNFAQAFVSSMRRSGFIMTVILGEYITHKSLTVYDSAISVLSSTYMVSRTVAGTDFKAEKTNGLKKEKRRNFAPNAPQVGP